MHQHLYAPHPLDGVPGPIQPLLHCVMAKDPSQRLSDASWFVAELKPPRTPPTGSAGGGTARSRTSAWHPADVAP
jgi:hypothetical protein